MMVDFLLMVCVTWRANVILLSCERLLRVIIIIIIITIIIAHHTVRHHRESTFHNTLLVIDCTYIDWDAFRYASNKTIIGIIAFVDLKVVNTIDLWWFRVQVYWTCACKTRLNGFAVWRLGFSVCFCTSRLFTCGASVAQPFHFSHCAVWSMANRLVH